MDRLACVVARLDAINSQDPRTGVFDGLRRPYELGYAMRLTEWVKRLRPAPSETLLIAARGQHVARWRVPRESEPMDRGGYLRWREGLKRLHAEETASAMRECGYTPAEIDAVREVILKRDRTGNPDTQTMEDALCLVFLEDQFHDFQPKVSDEKMAGILRKTWAKMSEAGRAQALAMPWSDAEREWIGAVLAGPPGGSK